MSNPRTVLLTATSDKDYEDAIRRGLEAAHLAHGNIRGVWITRRSTAGGVDDSARKFEVTMSVAYLDANPNPPPPSPGA